MTTQDTPTTCFPSWHAKLAPLVQGAQITVFSGCAVNAQGNVACAPETMRAKAEAQLRALAPGLFSGALSLEAYTLARYMESEVGSGTIEERVAVGEAAVNQAKRRGKSVLNVLLYNQGAGHPNYGFYGPIHDSDAGCVARGLAPGCGPFKRWASTSRDPTVTSLLIADLVMSGRSQNFARGAETQWGPDSLKPKPLTPERIASFVRSAANASRYYWVGPLPGVDPWHTWLVSKRDNVAPSSPEGQALILRGIGALPLQGSTPIRPAWPASMPLCPTNGAAPGSTSYRGLKIAAGVAGVAGASWLALVVAKNLAANATTLGRRRSRR